MREDSAEEMFSPTTVLALVKAPLASTDLEVGGVLFTAPVETLTPEELAEEVPPVFLVALEAVVMVVFPLVGGNLPLELSVVLEDIFTPFFQPPQKIGGELS